MKQFICYIGLLCILLTGCRSARVSMKPNKNLLTRLMRSEPDKFKAIMKHKDEYQVQIIYTMIDRDENNIPSFHSYSYNVDKSRYFYPASMVKMPVAFLTLEKLHDLQIPGLDKETVMLTDSAYSGQIRVHHDSTTASGLPSLASYIRQVFLVSDNQSFNRMYEFLGQAEINRKLREKGYEDTRIISRLSVFLSEDENRHTNPIRFMQNDRVIYSQPAAYNQGDLNLKGEVLKGKGHYDHGEYIDRPMDFTRKNFFPLDEMQLMLKAVLFPGQVDPRHTFDLTEEDYRFLYKYMSEFPSESVHPDYDPEEYYDSYSKLLMHGNDPAPLPRNIRSFSKFGQSYGYLIDNAYIVDFDKKIEFMVSAVIQTNANDIYNDNVYEYDEIGYPFLKNLGLLLYNYELERPRAYPPDLSRFKVEYDHHR